MVYIGSLTDVLGTHWSVETNAKTHSFCALKQFTERLACTAEEYGNTVEVRSEVWTSQGWPECGSTDRTTRHQDTITCPYGFEGHADLTASGRFRKRHIVKAVRPMTRPLRFEWDDHDWSGLSCFHRLKEQRIDPSTVHRDGNIASYGSA